MGDRFFYIWGCSKKKGYSPESETLLEAEEAA